MSFVKYLHMKDLTPKEIKAKLDNVHSISAPAFTAVYNWMNKFKVVVHPHVMYFVRDVWLRLLRQKSSIKSKILFWRVKVRELVETDTWHTDFVRTIRKKLTSAAFVHCELEARPCDDFETMFGGNVIQMNFCIDSLLWTKHGSLLHIRNKGIVKTMDFTGWTSSEEGEDLGRKDDGHSFLHAI